MHYIHYACHGTVIPLYWLEPLERGKALVIQYDWTCWNLHRKSEGPKWLHIRAISLSMHRMAPFEALFYKDIGGNQFSHNLHRGNRKIWSIHTSKLWRSTRVLRHLKSDFWAISLPSRHGPDFHRPQSQITIDSPDFHLRRSQKCLLGKDILHINHWPPPLQSKKFRISQTLALKWTKTLVSPHLSIPPSDGGWEYWTWVFQKNTTPPFAMRERLQPPPPPTCM